MQAALSAASLALVVALLAVQTAAAAPTPVNTSAPTLTGTSAPGQSLTCSPGSWSGNPSGFAYAWLRDGSPVPGQTASTYVVQSADQGHSLSCNVTATNSGGEYTIAGLPSGSYQVYFSHPLGIILEDNYLSQYFNGQASEQTANPVSVTVPNTVSGINAELQPGGQITGRVTSAATHAAIPNVEVCARNSTLVFGSCGTTDASGNYTIVALASGSYNVGVSVYGLNCSSKSSCPEQNYLEQGANNVSVTAPNTTTGTDLEMQPGGEIAGQVTDASTHAPLGNILVCASWSHREFVTSCTSSDSAGNYTLVGLPSRSYSVTFTAQTCVEGQGCKREQYPPQTFEPVSVTAPNTTKFDAALKPGGQITGTVTSIATHQPIVGVSVCAVEEAAEIEHNCGATNSAGEYTIIGLGSATYRVSFSASEYEEVQASPITVTAPNTVAGVNAELKPHSQPKNKGEITGRVTDASTHAPIANIQECVSQEGGQGGFWGCPRTNAAGEYSIEVPSGSYKVVFTTTTSICEFYGTIGCTEPNYLSQTVTAVSVTAPNTTTGVNAELQPGGQITGRVSSAATHAGMAGVVACAYATTNESLISCGATNGGGGSASAASNALSVPVSTTTVTTTKPASASGHGTKPLTATQKLAKALKACKKIRPKRKRKSCEARARRRYAPKHKHGHPRHHGKHMHGRPRRRLCQRQVQAGNRTRTETGDRGAELDDCVVPRVSQWLTRGRRHHDAVGGCGAYGFSWSGAGSVFS